MGFPRNLFLIIIFRSRFSSRRRCSSKQVLLEILQYSQDNMCIGVSFYEDSLFQPRLKRDFNPGVFLQKLQKFYFIEHLQCLLLLVWKKTVQWCACADLLILIKNKICEMVSTKKVCTSGLDCYLHVISKDHSKTLLLINLQKTKTCP